MQRPATQYNQGSDMHKAVSSDGMTSLTATVIFHLIVHNLSQYIMCTLTSRNLSHYIMRTLTSLNLSVSFFCDL